MKSLLHRVYRRLRKEHFRRQFLAFGLSSSLGVNGVGEGCKLTGTEFINIGEDSFFGEKTELTALHSHVDQKMNPRILIGNHVRCVGGCRITCAGKIIIENDVLIGPDVFITDHNHGMNPVLKGGYSGQRLLIKTVQVKEGVWLGQRSCVLPGVTIGEHSIIGANSVVTHDIPSYSIAVGAPAKIVKQWDFEKKQWIKMKSRD